MHLWFLRGCFGALLIGMATGVLVYLENQGQLVLGIVTFVGMLVLGITVVATDVFVRNKQITTLSAVYFGLLLGLLLGTLFSEALKPFLTEDPNKPSQLMRGIQLLITIVCCYVVTSTLLQTKDEFRFIIP